MKLLILAGFIGLISAQTQLDIQEGKPRIVEAKLPPAIEVKEKIEKKEVTEKYLNEDIEKDHVSLVCKCEGNFIDGDYIEPDEDFTGGETPKLTCDHICSKLKVISDELDEEEAESGERTHKRLKRQIGCGPGCFPRWRNFGFGSYFGGYPVGYGSLGFNLLGAWRGLGGCNYGCHALGCGSARGCSFGCTRAWMPAPIPVTIPLVRRIDVPVPRVVPVPKAVPIPVARRVDIPVYRRVDVPVPRDVPIPRPVDIPIPRKVDIPVVRKIDIPNPVPMPVPVPKEVRIARPYPVPIPIVPKRRLVVKRRLLYRPAIARVSGVAMVPVHGNVVAARSAAARAGYAIHGGAIQGLRFANSDLAIANANKAATDAAATAHFAGASGAAGLAHLAGATGGIVAPGPAKYSYSYTRTGPITGGATYYRAGGVGVPPPLPKKKN